MCPDTNGTCVEINQRVRFSENYCESASSTSTPSSRRSYGMTSHRWRTSRLICFPHRMEHSDLFIKPTHATYYRLDLCATQPLSQVHLDNSSQSHCSATTQPCWLERVVIDHNTTPSSWRRVDGVEVMIEPWWRRVATI